MNLTLLKFDIFRVFVWWLPCVCSVWLLVLFEPVPLGRWDVWVILSAAVLGAISAWRLFTDPHGTRTYIFTRGLSRGRLFWNRWGLGISGLLFVALGAVVLTASDARGAMSRWQQSPNALYYPMIRPFEIAIVPTLLGVAVLAYCATAFLVIRGGLEIPRSPSVWRGIWRSVGASFAVALIILAFVVATEVVVDDDGTPILFRISPVLFRPGMMRTLYLTLCPALATWGAAHAYRNLEVSV